MSEDFVGFFYDIEIFEYDVDFDKVLCREGIELILCLVYDLGLAFEVEKKKKKRAVNFERMNVINVYMFELFKVV